MYYKSQHISGLQKCNLTTFYPGCIWLPADIHYSKVSFQTVDVRASLISSRYVMLTGYILFAGHSRCVDVLDARSTQEAPLQFGPLSINGKIDLISCG